MCCEAGSRADNLGGGGGGGGARLCQGVSSASGEVGVWGAGGGQKKAEVTANEVKVLSRSPAPTHFLFLLSPAR